MVPVPVTLRVGERLHRAAEVFARTDFERLPVVDGGGKFRGILAKRDLLAVYAQEVLGRPAVLSTFVSNDQPGQKGQAVELPPDFALRSFDAPERLVGRSLVECDLPRRIGVRVIEIKRPGRGGPEWIVPGAATDLRAGDLLVVLGPTAAVEALSRGELAEPPPAETPARARRERRPPLPPAGLCARCRHAEVVASPAAASCAAAAPTPTCAIRSTRRCRCSRCPATKQRLGTLLRRAGRRRCVRVPS
jgi:CBS domain-containing protein